MICIVWNVTATQKKILSLTTKGMQMEIIVLSKMSHFQKDKYHVFFDLGQLTQITHTQKKQQR